MANPNDVVGFELLAFAQHKLRDHYAQIVRCVHLLDDEQLWKRANENTNSIANLLLHLSGNVNQWIVAGLGRNAVDRDRPAEFAARGGNTGEELIGRLGATVERALSILATFPPQRLAERLVIQEYEVAGVAAVMHVVEHFAFHTGQVVHMTKVLRNVNLSLYDAQGHRLAGSQP